MSTFYTKSQSDAQAAVVGARIKTATSPSNIKAGLEGLPDTNLLTDAERTKLSELESSKFMGSFTSSSAIPTVGATAGSYADVDAGAGETVQRWIYDVDTGAFVQSTGNIAGETAASVKAKYESNANTNAYTDAEKSKLAGLVEAPDINDFIAALDGALA